MELLGGVSWVTKSLIDDIQSDLQRIQKNAALYEEINFEHRVEALDYIEFNIINRIEGLLQTVNQPEELAALKQAAEMLKGQLEAIDDHVFQRLRADIRREGGLGPTLSAAIDEYVRYEERSGPADDAGYDSLDVFINGLLLTHPAPTETKEREPEMVYYQQTPARVILELIKTAPLTEQDVFYDVGSGLGQVAILVHLLSGATAKGIEFEPAYCDYARACAAELNLSRVEFINVDARQADYSAGTIFFMYTPFEGKLLQEVLEKLRRESHKRMIRLFTYGPCTPTVSRQSWLKDVGQTGPYIYQLAMFTSYRP